ncbi:putative beta-carotene-binding protein isoform X2 [Linepithema humile]|nr:PREDICTED: uncharacterized protein LOC105672454 isoform X2 [Linepithema humile]
MKSVNNLKSKLCKGIPELEVPPLEPLRLPKLILSETNNIKLYIDDLEVLGICGYTLNDVHVDLDKLTLKLNATLNNIFFNSTYDFDIRIMVAIATKGQLSFTANYLNLNLLCDLKMATKSGKKYLYMSKVTTNLEIEGFKTKFENDKSNQLQEIIANFIGNNEKEILTTFTPALEEAISKFVLSTANNIMKHFTYDELFPDRT